MPCCPLWFLPWSLVTLGQLCAPCTVEGDVFCRASHCLGTRRGPCCALVMSHAGWSRWQKMPSHYDAEMWAGLTEGLGALMVGCGGPGKQGHIKRFCLFSKKGCGKSLHFKHRTEAENIFLKGWRWLFTRRRIYKLYSYVFWLMNSVAEVLALKAGVKSWLFFCLGGECRVHRLAVYLQFFFVAEENNCDPWLCEWFKTALCCINLKLWTPKVCCE